MGRGGGERERERESVCVCVRERERERQRNPAHVLGCQERAVLVDLGQEHDAWIEAFVFRA